MSRRWEAVSGRRLTVTPAMAARRVRARALVGGRWHATAPRRVPLSLVLEGEPRVGQQLRAVPPRNVSGAVRWEVSEAIGQEWQGIPRGAPELQAGRADPLSLSERLSGLLIRARVAEGGRWWRSPPMLVRAASAERPVPLAAPTVVDAPAIMGTPTPEIESRLGTGTWTGNPTGFAFVWQRSTDGGATWVDVPGGNQQELTPSSDDLGAQVRGCVTATNRAGSATACTRQAMVVAAGITATPGFFPAFSPGIEDYVARCEGPGRVDLSFTLPNGLDASLDGAPFRAGTWSGGVDLSAGQSFRVEVGNGHSSRTHHVRCLPDDFPAWTFEKDGETRSRWYLVAPNLGPAAAANFVAIFSEHGVPVWWIRAGNGVFDGIDFKALETGELAWFEAGEYRLVDMFGAIIRTLQTVSAPTDFHDLQRMPEGNFLLMSYKPRDDVDLSSLGGPASATVTDAEIQEVTPEGGLVWSWNSKDHIALEELSPSFSSVLGGDPADIVHVNSVEHDGDAVIFSARHLDAVYKIDRASGEVIWKLGGTPRPESLQIVGDPLGSVSFGGQHDARVQPDGTLTLYDNGTGRNRPPRALRYEIDEAAGTATLIEQLTDDQAETSFCCGSARRLSNGSWVTSWTNNPIVTETRPGGSAVMRLTFDGPFSYRAVPIEKGSVLDERFPVSEFRAGMDVMNPR